MECSASKCRVRSRLTAGCRPESPRCGPSPYGRLQCPQPLRYCGADGRGRSPRSVASPAMPESPAEPPYRFRKSTRRPRATLPGLSVSRSPANLPPPRPGPVPAHRADTGSAQHIPSKRPQHREPSEAEKCDFQPTSRTWFRVGIPILEVDGILWRFRAFPLRDATLFTFHASSYIRRTVPVFRLRFRAAARVTSACRGSGRVWGWRRRRYRRARSAAAPFPGKPFAHKSRHRDGEVGAAARIVRDQADSKPVPHPRSAPRRHCGGCRLRKRRPIRTPNRQCHKIYIIPCV